MRNPIKGLKAMLIIGPIDSIYNQMHIKCYLHYAMELVLELMSYDWNRWQNIRLQMENKSFRNFLYMPALVSADQSNLCSLFVGN